MVINYILLVHKTPLQLKRLISKLSSPKSHFYIHVDKNVDVTPFKEILRQEKNIYFLDKKEREPGIWGDIGIVKATLSAIKRVVASGNNGYAILLSGQDYPLRNKFFIHNFINNNKDIHFLEIFKMPGPWKITGMDRLNKYKINKSTERGQFLLLPSLLDKEFYSFQTAGKINFLIKTRRYKELLKIFKKRKFPKHLDPYGGSVYWGLPVKTLEDILYFLVEHPDYLKFHEDTLCADEIFFHSIIMHLNSKKGLNIKPSLTYVNWKRQTGPLPVTFKKSDFLELKKASETKLFARKFDLETDATILDLIDVKLLEQS